MTAERPASEDDAASPGTGVSPPGGVAPSDAFQALGGETRVAILRRLARAEPCSFSDLFDLSGEDTSAGFAYHLRQLTDRFVRAREDDQYELTDAGRRVVRDVRAGTYTASVDRDPVGLDEDCPLCGESALFATVTDNVAEVGCRACGSGLLSTSVPPGSADRSPDRLPAAVDTRYRRRIDSFADGVCPECAGTVEESVELAETRYGGSDDGPTGDGDTDREGHAGGDHQSVQAVHACDTCGSTLRCPVTLTVLTHPAVVAFYHDHGEDIRDRPVWNVGPEWAESLLSRDPWCVRVRTRLDEEVLSLYVRRDGRVVDYRRRSVSEEKSGFADQTDDGPDHDDDPDGGSRPSSADDRAGQREGAADRDAPTAEDAEVTDPSASTDGAPA
jgi:DNA-binding transcriptional ArsR family regulator